MKNPFSTTFGIEPDNYIQRIDIFNQIISEYSYDNPSNYVYLITGVRGSGKTALLSSVANHFKKDSDWIVVDPGPKDNILENVASEIFEEANLKKFFLKKEFSFSFHGATFSIKGQIPVSTVHALLKRMLSILKDKGKHVLVTIDEVDSSEQMKYFIQSYQSLIRERYPILLLMTGLYENFSRLQDDKSLTFLYRAPKFFLGPLPLSSIANNYVKLLGVSTSISFDMAKLTKGYAYGYQTLGYLFFQHSYKQINTDLINQFDQYMAIYVYDKIYAKLSNIEQKILKTIKDEPTSNKEICQSMGMDIKKYSVYRDRLIKKGIISASSFGYVELSLPRFYDFLLFKK